MRYNQFDHLPKGEGDSYRKITEIVAKHLNVEGDDAAGLGGALISHGLLNPYEVFDLSKDIAALERISKSLLEISRAMSEASMSPLARRALSQSLLWGEDFEKVLATDRDFDADEFREFQIYIDNTGRKDCDALSRIESEVSRIRGSVDKTINHISKSPQAKKSASKFKSEAVGVVGACRFVWKLGREQDPPKSLNPASPFAYFIADIFQACGIDASPVSAFNAWVRENQKSTVRGTKLAPSVDD